MGQAGETGRREGSGRQEVARRDGRVGTDRQDGVRSGRQRGLGRRAPGHRMLRNRWLLPLGLVSAVAMGGAAVAAGGAAGGATSDGSGSTSTTSTTSLAGKGASHPASEPGHRTFVYRNGELIAYGSHHTIVYTVPPSVFIPAGQALFAQDCASCHGTDAQGTQYAPNLVGLGPATIDFWITTGRMPAKNPRAVQAPEKPPQLTDRQALEVAAYVNSLDPATPYIPHVNTQSASLAEGADLFSINCAACHTITGAGDALAKNTFSPSLHTDGQPTATQVAEAIRTGPANMPRFNGGNLTDAEVADVTKYVVEKIQHPSNPGGFGLGGIGPVTEGFVGLLFGVGGMMLLAYWTGDRTEKDEEGDEGEGGSGHGGGGESSTPEPVGGGHA